MRQVLRAAQKGLMVVGVLLLGFYVGAIFHAAITSQIATSRFVATEVSPNSAQSLPSSVKTPQKLDFTLWSEKRIAAYKESLLGHFDPAVAVMRIRRLSLEAPVFEGVDDLTLNRGVGHIPGTALPGESGNFALAGHRDGFFRVLKDVVPGDEIEVLTTTKRYTYSVDQIVLVLPKDVSVLAPASHQSLTLVTCYPFYFIGSAPQRYIVKALFVKSEALPMARENDNEIANATP